MTGGREGGRKRGREKEGGREGGREGGKSRHLPRAPELSLQYGECHVVGEGRDRILKLL
jgi:hypothetical protein